MKYFTIEEFLEEIGRTKPMPPRVMATEGYGTLRFDCGCGESHGVNDFDIEVIASFFPVKFLFKCSTHYTKVRVKGLFTQTCISEWAIDNNLVGEFTEKHNL